MPFEKSSKNGELLGGSLSRQLSGSYNFVRGVVGNALYIPGDPDSNLYLGNRRDGCFWSPKLCTNGYTLALWIKIGPKKGKVLFFLTNGGHTKASYGISLHLKPTNRLGFWLSTSKRIFKVECIITRNKWFHLAVVWRYNKMLKAFIDGKICGSKVYGAQQIVSHTAYNGFYFGAENKGVKNELGGEATYDELLFWNEYKSETDIHNLFLSYLYLGNKPNHDQNVQDSTRYNLY